MLSCPALVPPLPRRRNPSQLFSQETKTHILYTPYTTSTLNSNDHKPSETVPTPPSDPPKQEQEKEGLSPTKTHHVSSSIFIYFVGAERVRSAAQGKVFEVRSKHNSWLGEGHVCAVLITGIGA
ncbi:hypothetical protein S245_008144 [Arachis hypogaea]